MLRAKVEIGKTSEMPGQNANCPKSLGKMSYFGFLPGKPSYDQPHLGKTAKTVY
jgi:hypothetical protein